ncbi:MAG: methionyl-tRNA formyltransferase [Bacteroidota bacterium]|nr:methionyl-tRNA formyltransferase [Bacteroidota bacterium]MDP4205657.1 methionyl-tRNA formyltransferase [Bacteroidota bacterium]
MKAKSLRIVFMGTPEFAVESLDALVSQNYNVVGVVTVPDKPAGRGQQVTESAVKKYAVAKGLPVLQPEKLKDPLFIEQLKAWKADLQIVVAFRMLPEIVWTMPLLGTFNLHGSLLPNYRGAAPLNWAIINGDKETGVTTFMLKHEIDTGNILFQESIPIEDDDNVEIIHDKLMVIGAELVLKTVDAIADGKIDPIPQEAFGADVKPAPKIFKDDCRIDWTSEGEKIRNKIRGLSPYPGAWTTLVPKDDGGPVLTMKIFETKFTSRKNLFEPGTIIALDKTAILITCQDGVIEVESLQLAGKKRMKKDDFLRGFSSLGSYKAV